LILLGAVNLLVGALGSAQLIPTVELLINSRRHEPIPYKEAASWSLNPWALVNLFFLDKSVDLGLGDGTQLFFSRDIPFFVSYYFGVISIFGIILWLFYSPFKEKIFLGTLLLLSLILAFGAFTPVYPFLYQRVSIFRSFRYPEKLFFLTQGFFLFAAFKGLSSFLADDPKGSNGSLIITGVVGGVLLSVYLIFRFNPVLLSDFIIRQKALVLPAQWTISNAASVLVSLERQLILMAGLWTLLFMGKKQHLGMSLFKFLLVAVVFIDLNGAHQGFQYLLKPELVLNRSKILGAPDADPDRVFYYPTGSNLHPSTFSILRPPSTPFGEIYGIVSSNLLPNAGVLFGFDYMQDINALAKTSYIEFLRFSNRIRPARQFRLLGALNVKYVVSFRALSAPGITLVHHFPQYPSWLYSVDYFVPRVYIVDRVGQVTEPVETLEELSGNRFDPFREVLLDGPLALLGQRDFQGRAKLLEYTNESVRVRATLNGSGILVLTDSFYPGWHAYVDGREAKILRANYFFRAVVLSRGEHVVEFRYEPASFRVGVIVSLCTILSLLLIASFIYWKNRKYPPTEDSSRWLRKFNRRG
jgi:hypothetical protein